MVTFGQVFSDKLIEVEEVAANNDGGTIEKLRGKCAKNVKEALHNQLSLSSYFSDDGNSEEKPDDTTLKKAPLTNLGCESEFGFVTNDFKEVQRPLLRYQTSTSLHETSFTKIRDLQTCQRKKNSKDSNGLAIVHKQ